MAISDKNRKILWARSGNQCAICRIPFVIEKTARDPHCIVGEECHIVSASPNGPRHDPNFKTEQFDTIENILLLCASHHKMVDDQPETYTASVLQSIKANHEKWVEEKLRNEPEVSRVHIRRIAENIPATIPRITSGKELLALASGVHGHYFDHDDGLTGDEVDLVGNFAQEITDWMNFSADLEPLDRIRFSSRCQEMIDELKNQNFYLFAAQEVQRMEGGTAGTEPWIVLHISVLRTSNPAIKYRTKLKTNVDCVKNDKPN